jgi:hypothetical protein
MTQPSLYQQLKRACSPDRIEAYRNSGDDDHEALARYVWNTCLCESLYPALQNLEIGLRNSLNSAITKSLNDSHWFKRTNIVIDAGGKTILSKT